MTKPVFFINGSVLELYTKKDETAVEYKNVTRVDYLEPIKNICQRFW